MKKAFILFLSASLISLITLGCSGGSLPSVNAGEPNPVQSSGTPQKPGSTSQIPGADTGGMAKERLFELCKMNKDGIFKELGENYTIERVGLQGSEEGYFYENLGITIVFMKDGSVNRILCSEKININGARSGMKLQEVQRHLGKAEIKQGWIEGMHSVLLLNYSMDGCQVVFRAEPDLESPASLNIHSDLSKGEPYISDKYME